MPLPTFVLWKWHSQGYRTPYTAAHVNTMVGMMLREGVPLENIVCVTDDPKGVACRTSPLWTDLAQLKNVSGRHLPSCYRRLKLFDPATQSDLGIKVGTRIVSIDIDAVLLQKFLSLFDRQETFMGWAVPGSKHNVVYNGSMWMFTAGELGYVWSQFDPDRSPAKAFAAGYMGSDQGYLSHSLVNRPGHGGWTAMKDGVLSYSRDVRALRVLPRHGRVVFFAGVRKPWDTMVRHVSPWIVRYTDTAQIVKETVATKIKDTVTTQQEAVA